MDLKIEYDAANNTLWLGNSRPAQTACPIIEVSVVVYFQAGDGNILETDGKLNILGEELFPSSTSSGGYGW